MHQADAKVPPSTSLGKQYLLEGVGGGLLLWLQTGSPAMMMMMTWLFSIPGLTVTNPPFDLEGGSHPKQEMIRTPGLQRYGCIFYLF